MSPDRNARQAAQDTHYDYGDDRPDAEDTAGALHRCGRCEACRAWGVGR